MVGGAEAGGGCESEEEEDSSATCRSFVSAGDTVMPGAKRPRCRHFTLGGNPPRPSEMRVLNPPQESARQPLTQLKAPNVWIGSVASPERPPQRGRGARVKSGTEAGRSYGRGGQSRRRNVYCGGNRGRYILSSIYVSHFEMTPSRCGAAAMCSVASMGTLEEIFLGKVEGPANLHPMVDLPIAWCRCRCEPNGSTLSFDSRCTVGMMPLYYLPTFPPAEEQA